MSELPDLVKLLLRKGEVWVLWKQSFPDGTVRTKYCVVMEDFDDPYTDVAVALTTSRMDYAHMPSTVVIPHGTFAEIEGDSLVDLNNVHLVPFERFCNKDESMHVGRLCGGIMRQLEAALVYATRVPPEIMVRMRGPQV